MAKGSSTPRIVYAANRRIGVHCLQMLLSADMPPLALLVPSGTEAEATEEMRKLLPDVPAFIGKDGLKEAARTLPTVAPEYLLSVHFPLIIPPEMLSILSIGTLNLHPAFLPWNRGWHTPSWAILEGTPYGATLHWVDAGLDTGNIALQRKMDVLPGDTAHSLYQRVLKEEEEVFRDAIPLLRDGKLPKIPQKEKGTMHKKADLQTMQRIDPASMSGNEIFRRLRALTTNRPEEAAYIEEGGTRYRIHLETSPEK